MMKRIFSTKVGKFNLNLGLLILRLSAGGFMLTHGYPKLQRIISGEMRFGDPLGLGPEVSLVLAVFAEFFCAILVMLGLGTRLATIPLIVTMAVAAFIAHGADPFSRKEMALLYLASFLVLLLTGGGKFSVDYFLNRKR